MSTFDSWDTELVHWGILGMKHGQNRYQNPDGTWTAEGLERRRQRERKALEKQARSAKKSKRLKDMTDDELRSKIARANLEKEYRDATKSQFSKNIASIATSYADYKTKQFERQRQKEKEKLEAMRYRTQQVEALYKYKTAVQEKKTAKANKAGDKAKLINTQADKTIHGAIRARLARFIGSTPMSIAQAKAKKQKDKLAMMQLNKKVSDIAAEIYTDPTTYEALRNQIENDYYKKPKEPDYVYDYDGKRVPKK